MNKYGVNSSQMNDKFRFKSILKMSVSHLCHMCDIIFMFHTHVDPEDGSSLFLRNDAQLQSVVCISFRTVGQ
jgi:hypothetical protein